MLEKGSSISPTSVSINDQKSLLKTRKSRKMDRDQSGHSQPWKNTMTPWVSTVTRYFRYYSAIWRYQRSHSQNLHQRRTCHAWYSLKNSGKKNMWVLAVWVWYSCWQQLEALAHGSQRLPISQFKFAHGQKNKTHFADWLVESHRHRIQQSQKPVENEKEVKGETFQLRKPRQEILLKEHKQLITVKLQQLFGHPESLRLDGSVRVLIVNEQNR